MVERPLLDGRPEIRNPRGNARGRSVTRARADSRVARAKLADRRIPPCRQTANGWQCRSLTADTTNIWALSTRTGAWQQVTDFGDRATFIARRVSWSAERTVDSRRGRRRRRRHRAARWRAHVRSGIVTLLSSGSPQRLSSQRRGGTEPSPGPPNNPCGAAAMRSSTRRGQTTGLTITPEAPRYSPGGKADEWLPGAI